MIRIKPDILNVRDPETGKFESVAAIKGADGVVENLGAFATNETGDSENLLMTQKGVTDIRNELKDELDSIDDTYLSKTSASSTYLTKTAANNTYLKKSEATGGNVSYADKAGYADEAGVADRANCDGAGNDIAATYLKKSEAPGDSVSQAMIDGAINDFKDELTSGEAVVGKASYATTAEAALYAYNAGCDGAGNDIAATYLKKSEASGGDVSQALIDDAINGLKQELGDGRFVVGEAVAADLSTATDMVKAKMLSSTSDNEYPLVAHHYSATENISGTYRETFSSGVTYNPVTDTLKVGKVDATVTNAENVVSSKTAADYTMYMPQGECTIAEALPKGVYAVEVSITSGKNRCGIYSNITGNGTALLGRDITFSRKTGTSETYQISDVDESETISGTVYLYRLMSFPNM